MFPKEHGAYGQLLFPIATALAIGRPSVSALCVSAAVACAFLAHEPLLVLIGGRGARAQREQRGRAVRWCLSLSALAIAFGAAAIVTLTPVARMAAIVPAALGAVLLVLVVAGAERTVAGEALTALALASAAFPIALACGASLVAASTCATVFATGMAPAAIAVRAVIACRRHPPAFGARIAAAAVAMAAPAALAWLNLSGVLADAAPWTAMPLSAASVALAIAAPGAKHLRRVGWTLIAATTLTAIALVATQR